MGKVIVAGSINMDIVATLDRAPRPGETVPGRDVTFCPGGKGLNQAVAAARQGADVAFIGRVGTDASGAQTLDFLAGTGVDTAAVIRSATRATGTALVMVDARAENQIVVIPGSNGEVAVADLSAVPLSAGDVLVSQFEIPRPTIAAFFQAGRAAGALTILNAAPALDDAPADLWAAVDLLVVNETELGHFAGVDLGEDTDADAITAAARALIGSRLPSVATVVATLGRRGALAVTRADAVTVPGRVVTPVDTTGAGDCFVGTLAARLAAGDALATALRHANVAASIAVTRVGSGTAMPTAAEVAALV